MTLTLNKSFLNLIDLFFKQHLKEAVKKCLFIQINAKINYNFKNTSMQISK